ncbi:MAG: hypothetical protein AAFV88_07080, partial [Planctomycetota bacterium]
MYKNLFRSIAGLCSALLLAGTLSAGCGDCGGCASGSDCVAGGGVVVGSGGGMAGAGACGPTVTYQTQTVMRPQMVTETRMVPTTSYQTETRTRMRSVTRQVA